jgi:hypothetical protein
MAVSSGPATGGASCSTIIMPLKTLQQRIQALICRSDVDAIIIFSLAEAASQKRIKNKSTRSLITLRFQLLKY